MSDKSRLLPIIGFDPGISGAYAVLGHDGELTDDFPVMNGEIHAPELARIVRLHRPRFAVVEHVHSMPKQGVASTFKFGRADGVLYGVLAALEVPTIKVGSHQWKRFFHLTGKPKDASRALAIKLYPSIANLNFKKHHGRADALLLARYLYETERFT